MVVGANIGAHLWLVQYTTQTQAISVPTEKGELTMREKLIELIQSAVNGCATYWAGLIADHLIANGVTVTDNNVGCKWIPVTERLPEKNDYYLCCVKSFLFPGRTYINILEFCKDGFKEGHIYTDDVTHWMPLPEPPKGGINRG